MLRIAVMGVKHIHVMVPLEDMVEFMDPNMVRIKELVCQVEAVLAVLHIQNLHPEVLQTCIPV